MACTPKPINMRLNTPIVMNKACNNTIQTDRKTLQTKLFQPQLVPTKKISQMTQRKTNVDPLSGKQIEILMRMEHYCFDFVMKTNESQEFYTLFKDYIDFVQEENFDWIFTRFDIEEANQIKRALYLERLSFLICFLLELKNQYRAE